MFIVFQNIQKSIEYVSMNCSHFKTLAIHISWLCSIFSLTNLFRSIVPSTFVITLTRTISLGFFQKKHQKHTFHAILGRSSLRLSVEYNQETCMIRVWHCQLVVSLPDIRRLSPLIPQQNKAEQFVIHSFEYVYTLVLALPCRQFFTQRIPHVITDVERFFSLRYDPPNGSKRSLFSFVEVI
jgi:hypothetical protein